jgi:hypothetical protein
MVRMLRYDELLAVELTAILKQGGTERLSRLLAADPALASSVVEAAKGAGRSPLHLFADWPGHNPSPDAIVHALAHAGADLDASAVGMWHREAVERLSRRSAYGGRIPSDTRRRPELGGSLVRAITAGNRAAVVPR